MKIHSTCCMIFNLQIGNGCCLFVPKNGHFQSKANTVVILITIEIIFTQRLSTYCHFKTEACRNLEMAN